MARSNIQSDFYLFLGKGLWCNHCGRVKFFQSQINFGPLQKVCAIQTWTILVRNRHGTAESFPWVTSHTGTASPPFSGWSPLCIVIIPRFPSSYPHLKVIQIFHVGWWAKICLLYIYIFNYHVKQDPTPANQIPVVSACAISFASCHCRNVYRIPPTGSGLPPARTAEMQAFVRVAVATVRLAWVKFGEWSVPYWATWLFVKLW